MNFVHIRQSLLLPSALTPSVRVLLHPTMVMYGAAYVYSHTACNLLKGTLAQDFDFRFFSWISFSPRPWVYLQGRCEFFWKFTEIFAAQDAPSVLLTPVANGKNLQLETFNYFVWTPLGSSVVDTGGKFVTSINSTSATFGKICCRCC